MEDRYTSISRSRGLGEIKKKKTPKSMIIIIIVLAGLSVVGFILFLTRKKPEEETPVEEEVTEEENDVTEDLEQDEIAEVDVTDKESDENAEGAPTADDFSQDTQEVGDEETTAVKITKVEHEGYEGFFRIIFFVESDDGFPYTNAELQAGSNLIQLSFSGIESDSSGIKAGSGADVTGSVVSSIFHKVTGEEEKSYYSIGIKQTTSFYLHTLEDPSRVVLDIQEQEVTDGDGEEFAFSTGKQSFDGNASGNDVTINGISYSSQGDVFRVIFRLETVNTASIPKAESEIVDYEGGRAIKMTVSNLHADYISKDGYEVDYNNSVVDSMIGSYSDNVSTYYIKLHSENEYKLYYMTAPAQMMVDVKL